jgi:hypothetical protein
MASILEAAGGIKVFWFFSSEKNIFLRTPRKNSGVRRTKVHTWTVCTVIVSIASSPAWPLLLAANRDEKLDRIARPPGCHWSEQPDVLGGLDVVAGGTWLAINRAGVVAAVLNRLGSLGPAPGKRSRGELPLMALRHPTAASAGAALAELNASHWRSFHMIVGDRDGTWYVRGTGQGPVHVQKLPAGQHMITARDPNDASSPRVARNLPRFLAAPAPNPPDWSTWPALLRDSAPPLEAAINITPFAGFGTVSSALVGIAGTGKAVYLATNAAPHLSPFLHVDWPA